jgi:serine/threonine-protein kinase RsbW
MRGKNAVRSQPRLTIQSRLQDLPLLWSWVDSLAAEYRIPDNTLYSIHLCLEEAISNVIRHGYQGRSGQIITVEFTRRANAVEFIVEDQASPFDPLSMPEIDPATVPASLDEFPLGGRGIGLMRKFAGSLAYQRLAAGNRLTMRFPLGR